MIKIPIREDLQFGQPDAPRRIIAMQRLPNEILLGIADFLDSERDLNALCQVNHANRDALEPKLYLLNANNHESSALIWAAKHGHLTTAQKFVKFVCSIDQHPATYVNAVDDDHRTPISWASDRGDINTVKLLLSIPGVDIHRTNKYEQTPLHYAITGGNITVTEELLSWEHIDVNSYTKDDRPLLIHACMYGQVKAAKLLLDKGAGVNGADFRGGTALYYACNRGDGAMVDMLLSTEGLDVNAVCVGGFSPFMTAVKRNQVSVVKRLLILDDVDVNLSDDNGWTPFIWAAHLGHEQVLRLLMACPRSDLDAVGNHGETAVTHAAAAGHEGIVKMLQG